MSSSADKEADSRELQDYYHVTGQPPYDAAADLNQNQNQIDANEDSGPMFDMSTETNTTVLVGRTAHLHCRVHRLGNRTVSDRSQSPVKINLLKK